MFGGERFPLFGITDEKAQIAKPIDLPSETVSEFLQRREGVGLEERSLGAGDFQAMRDVGRRLFDAAREPKTFYAIRGAHHNDTFVAGGRAYFDVWAQFLSGL